MALKNNLALRILTVLGVVALSTHFFGTLTGNASFAFRDVAHFYYPLASYLDWRSEQTLFPLWNNLDSFGIPLAGETSTAIFYPPRILFAVLFPPHTATAASIFAHLIWAGFGVYRLTKQQSQHRTTSTIAAFSYVGSGSVFFLYTNPPFLVGAAWLPWIFYYLTKQQRTEFKKAPVNTLLASVSIAMSILGGDPQTAFHALLMWVIWQVAVKLHFLCASRIRQTPVVDLAKDPSHAPVVDLVKGPLEPEDREREGSLTRSTTSGTLYSFFTIRGILQFSLLILLSICLALPQVAASISWSSQSHRAATAAPHIGTQLSLLFQTRAQPNYSSMENQLNVRRHSDKVLDFSVAPWHIAELLSPYVSGRPFPINARATRNLSNEPRMWTPTIYCGFLAGICFLITLSRPKLATPWSSLAIIAFLLAIGQFGIYWLLYTFVPGYGQFRFPAKWLPLFSLGVCVHAGILLSTFKSQSSRSFTKILTLFSAVTGLFLILIFSPLTNHLASYFAPSSDHYWGPFRFTNWITDLRYSVSQTWVLITAVAIACYFVHARRLKVKQLGLILLILCIADLYCATRWQLATISNTVSESRIANSGAALFDQPTSTPRRYLLSQSHQPWPNSWKNTSDAKRLADVYFAEQKTWFGRWHLADRTAVVNNALSLPSHRSVLFWAALNSRVKQLSPEKHRQVLDAIASYLSLDGIATRHQGQLKFYSQPDNLPFCRWHQTWEVCAPLADSELPQKIVQLIDQISSDAQPVVPIIEIPENTPEYQASNVVDAEYQRVTAKLGEPKFTGDSLTIEVESTTSGFLQVMQMQDGYWQAELMNSQSGKITKATVYRTDVVSQGLFVPAGDWRVQLTYKPAWLVPTLFIQWMSVCIAFGVLTKNRRRKHGLQPNLSNTSVLTI